MQPEAPHSLRYRFGSLEYDLSARTHIMGVLNVTPDSFSDGGKYVDAGAAVARALEMIGEGADFIDIGGESTRPGAELIPAEEEITRVVPVIKKLVAVTNTPISIDTYKADVAEHALDAGAVLVNDITGLHADPSIAELVASHDASIVLMHIQGTPQTMQKEPRYVDLIGEISAYLSEGILVARDAGVHQIIVDPGIGFGKTLAHNLSIFHRLDEFQKLGYPVMIGPSRKSFLNTLLGLPVDERVEGTAGAVAASIMRGANIIRVHDVKAMKRVAGVVDAILRAG